MSIELLGLLATLFIVLAFCNNDKKLIRLFDSIGALLFVIYGLITGALSVWILNAILIIVNAYKIIKKK